MRAMNRHAGYQVYAIITVGFPFVIYKAVIGGLLLIHWPPLIAVPLALFLFFLATVDLGTNTLNLYSYITRGKGKVRTCFLTLLGHEFAARRGHDIRLWEEVGTAADMMLAFTFVSVMIGGNLFYLFNEPVLYLWNGCTVINILGAGVARLAPALFQARTVS